MRGASAYSLHGEWQCEAHPYVDMGVVFFRQAALTTTTCNLHQTINFNGPTDFVLLRISVTAVHGPVPVGEVPAQCTRFSALCERTTLGPVVPLKRGLWAV